MNPVSSSGNSPLVGRQSSPSGAVASSQNATAQKTDNVVRGMFSSFEILAERINGGPFIRGVNDSAPDRRRGLPEHLLRSPEPGPKSNVTVQGSQEKVKTSVVNSSPGGKPPLSRSQGQGPLPPSDVAQQDFRRGISDDNRTATARKTDSVVRGMFSSFEILAERINGGPFIRGVNGSAPDRRRGLPEHLLRSPEPRKEP